MYAVHISFLHVIFVVQIGPNLCLSYVTIILDICGSLYASMTNKH